MVIATQNPIEQEGTFPLPEAQLDRFLLKLEMCYPVGVEELEILKRFKKGDPLTEIEPVIQAADIVKLREEVKGVEITEDLLKYITKLAVASRENDKLRLGLSPRGSLAIMKASLAYAYIQGRDYVPVSYTHLTLPTTPYV